MTPPSAQARLAIHFWISAYVSGAFKWALTPWPVFLGMYDEKSVVEGKRTLVPSTRFVPLTIWRQLAVQVRLKVRISSSGREWKERCVLILVPSDDDDGVGVEGRRGSGHGQPFTNRGTVFGVLGELEDGCRPAYVSGPREREGMDSNVPAS
jgi:hypothetical protein